MLVEYQIALSGAGQLIFASSYGSVAVPARYKARKAAILVCSSVENSGIFIYLYSVKRCGVLFAAVDLDVERIAVYH